MFENKITLVTDETSPANEIRYISNLLLDLAGVNTGLAEKKGTETGLFKDNIQIAGIEKLIELFNIISLKNEFTALKDIHGRACEKENERNKIPVLNEFAAKINTCGQKENKFRVIFTHDIDWITGLEPVSMYKSLRYAVNKNSEKWLSLVKILDKNIFLRGMHDVIKLEQKYGIKSWFFLLPGSYGVKRFSDRYNSNWKLFGKMISLIKDNSCEIGLHGSYDAMDADSYKQQAESLSENAGVKIDRHRNHYLRINPETLTESMESAGIKYDLSVGYNSMMGFRAGLANIYNLYNHREKLKSPVKEIPLVFMERDRYLEDERKAFHEIWVMLNEVKKYNGCVSVLFHPENFAVENRWFDFYRRFIEMAIELGADISGSVN